MRAAAPSRLSGATAIVLGVTLGLAACGGPSDRAARVDGTTSSSANTTPGTVSTARPVATTLPARGDEPFAVGVHEDTYVDEREATSAVADYPGAPTRTFPVAVWYPATGPSGHAPVEDAPADRRARYPLVLFAHGYAVTPQFYEALLTRWARAGYVVVAPTYPLLSGVPAGPSHEDYGLVFSDTGFVLGQVLGDLGRMSSGHPLAGLVDPSRVAVAGHSDGEVAAFGVGFLECCRDARVEAVIAMAGILGNVANPVRRDTGVPVLHIVGEADELQPYGEAVAWDREHLTPPRWIMTLVGGSHAAPYADPRSPHFDGVVETTVAFLDGTIGGRPDRLRHLDAFVAANGDRFRLER